MPVRAFLFADTLDRGGPSWTTHFQTKTYLGEF